jgi:hypothetical protein
MKEFRETGYFVTEDGQIFGKKKILKKTELPDGYQSVCLYFNGKSKNFLVHRIVAETYLDNPSNKPQVNHKDLNKKNNCVSNLEWVTSKENIHHYISQNEKSFGSFPNSKIDLETAKSIYRYNKIEGIYQKDLSKLYKVDRSTISRIIKQMQPKYV